MNWISDILKKLDIKTTPLLISILVALFYIKSAGRALLDVLIVFIISYLLCITIMHSFFYIKQRLNESTIKKRRNEKMRKKIVEEMKGKGLDPNEDESESEGFGAIMTNIK